MLLVEFGLLFFAAPTLFAFTRHRLPAIPSLWVLALYCLLYLLHDAKFNRIRLWNDAPLLKFAPQILALFLVAVLLGFTLVSRLEPDLLFSFPKTNPGLWALVMALYPVLSVYPQGIIYRSYIFERYKPLFGDSWLMVLASAVAFSYVHIVFKNGLAVGLTFLGGLLFAFRYLQTGSLLASSFEHALYGCAIFTIGLGRSFYHGAVQR